MVIGRNMLTMRLVLALLIKLVEADKKKIRQEYERKQKQVEIRKKIEYSMQLNASRIKVLQAQDDVINNMKEAASKELLNVRYD
ncbi:hypothetical protein EI015_26810, partial [Escherichia coli]|nr:hypothetical protein [Escherichia coli]